jgi:hypothetical protein
MDSVREGERVEAVLERLGKPARDASRPGAVASATARRRSRYTTANCTTGTVSAAPTSFSGKACCKTSTFARLVSIERQRNMYNGVFHYYYLKLAIFFGCLGIFMNLFRGEMLDKTLHFWLLAPARRDVLLGGKYLAGLLAAYVIFGAGAALTYGGHALARGSAEVRDLLRRPRTAHRSLRYAAAALLACLGYGSVFLAAGLLVRNPIIPAVVLLMWESMNGFCRRCCRRSACCTMSSRCARCPRRLMTALRRSSACSSRPRPPRRGRSLFWVCVRSPRRSFTSPRRRSNGSKSTMAEIKAAVWSLSPPENRP